MSFVNFSELFDLLKFKTNDIEFCINTCERYINLNFCFGSDVIYKVLKMIPENDNRFKLFSVFVSKKAIPSDLSVDQTLGLFRSSTESLRFEIVSSLLAFNCNINPFFILVYFDDTDEEYKSNVFQLLLYHGHIPVDKIVTCLLLLIKPSTKMHVLTKVIPFEKLINISESNLKKLIDSFSDQTEIRKFLSSISYQYRTWIQSFPLPSPPLEQPQLLSSYRSYGTDRLLDGLQHQTYPSYGFLPPIFPSFSSLVYPYSTSLGRSTMTSSAFNSNLIGDQLQPRVFHQPISPTFPSPPTFTTQSHGNDVSGIPTSEDLKKDEDISSSNVQELICTICLTNRRRIIFIDCNHFATCFSCAQTIAQQSKKCPICRKSITRMSPVITS